MSLFSAPGAAGAASSNSRFACAASLALVVQSLGRSPGVSSRTGHSARICSLHVGEVELTSDEQSTKRTRHESSTAPIDTECAGYAARATDFEPFASRCGLERRIASSEIGWFMRVVCVILPERTAPLDEGAEPSPCSWLVPALAPSGYVVELRPGYQILRDQALVLTPVDAELLSDKSQVFEIAVAVTTRVAHRFVISSGAVTFGGE